MSDKNGYIDQTSNKISHVEQMSDDSMGENKVGQQKSNENKEVRQGDDTTSMINGHSQKLEMSAKITDKIGGGNMCHRLASWTFAKAATLLFKHCVVVC